MGKKVIVAGHICLDITPVIPGEKAAVLGDLLMPGKLIRVGEANIHAGGAVANTGLAMKLLGAEVSLMGKIGGDSFGRIVREILNGYGVKEGLIIAEKEETSYSVVLAVPGLDRIFLHNPGANDTFCAEDIPEEALAGASLFHFGYPPLMRTMYAEEGKEMVELFQRARRNGIATSLDLASVDADSEAGRADWENILKKIIPFVDFFVPSAEELCFMLDRERFTDWQKRAAGGDITEILDIERDIRPLAQRCMEFGAKVLLIKCGAAGIYYRSAGKHKLMEAGPGAGLDVGRWADLEGFEESYRPNRILSGTGAGDTSIAAFLTAMLEGRSPKECIQLAAAAGASCVEAYDALSGLKPLEELQRKIAAGWEKRRPKYAD